MLSRGEQQGGRSALAAQRNDVSATPGSVSRAARRASPTVALAPETQVLLRELLQVCGDGLGHAASGCGSASGIGSACGSGSRARREARRPHSTLPAMKSTDTRKIALAMTFTCGGTETLAAPQTKSGNVVVEPATKYV